MSNKANSNDRAESEREGRRGALFATGVGLSVLLACMGQERGSGEPRLLGELAGSRAGRVVLHTVCVVQHPQRLAWHWRGIVRELSFRPATMAAH